MGGTTKIGPRKRELFERYTAMRWAIHRAAAWANPAALVEKYFPGAAFDRMLAAARAEAKTMQERLRAEADGGIFLW